MLGEEEDDDDDDNDDGVVAWAAAAASLWMDFGDMRVVGMWVDGWIGKLRLAEEPLRHKSAAS